MSLISVLNSDFIQESRIQHLNRQTTVKGDFIIYWMQASQRTEYNHALEFAIHKANILAQPLIVFFGLTMDFPEANFRHFHFMLQGLQEVRDVLKERKILLVVQKGNPVELLVPLARNASLVVTDRGYLRIQRKWRWEAARALTCPLIQIESDCLVPVEEASPKEEFSAATFRPRINSRIKYYLKPLESIDLKVSSLGMDFGSLEFNDLTGTDVSSPVQLEVGPVDAFRGGASQARRRLEEFLTNRLEYYPESRNDPNLEVHSELSPYLHFGQISPLYVALESLETGSRGLDAFLEELVVRRELAINYTFYNPDYDVYSGLPVWAKNTLDLHRKDKREVIYSRSELEEAATHDKYWNAAQKEMLSTGKMHGYMRMYWGKKILEWTETPEEGFRIALYLNNKYELDGRDPNGYAGVAWCFGKHDRPWGQRPVFGNIRYMNASGLKRKFDAEKYASRFLNI